MRLDKFLTDKYASAGITRSQILPVIKSGEVFVNGTAVKKAGYEIKEDDKIECDRLSRPLASPPSAVPENIPLDIVYEDEDLMVINKPRGMVVHPGAGVKSGTVLNALLGTADRKLERGGIVHRLDKNTAGLMIVAKTVKAQGLLSKMFEKHEITRTYIGIIEGKVPADMTINKNIIRHPTRRTLFTVTDKGGRTAVTHLTVRECFDKYTVCGFTLETGRTHQIRVHCKAINHSIVGDPEYNPSGCIKYNGQMLEAVKLEFNHPVTAKRINIEIPPTKEWTAVREKCYSIK